MTDAYSKVAIDPVLVDRFSIADMANVAEMQIRAIGTFAESTGRVLDWSKAEYRAGKFGDREALTLVVPEVAA